MNLKEQNNGDVTVMTLSGDVMNDDALNKFIERVHRLKEEGHNSVVVDLGGVRLINSGGVGMLVGGMTTLRKADGDMKLANLSDRAERVLVALGQLGRIFDIHTTVEEAVAGFAASRKTA